MIWLKLLFPFQKVAVTLLREKDFFGPKIGKGNLCLPRENKHFATELNMSPLEEITFYMGYNLALKFVTKS